MSISFTAWLIYLKTISLHSCTISYSFVIFFLFYLSLSFPFLSLFSLVLFSSNFFIFFKFLFLSLFLFFCFSLFPILSFPAETGDYNMMTPSGQWDLLGLPVKASLTKYGCCPDPFSDITFRLQLRRKALFYVFNLLFPSIFMSLMSLLSFYLPAESGEKLGLNITVLLSLVFFLLLGAQLLPPTSDSVSLLGRYCMSSYSLLLCNSIRVVKYE